MYYILRGRITGHRQSINNKWNHLPVAEHFNKTNHTMEDMQITVLKGPIPNIHQRQIAEQKLIKHFNSTIYGLNRDLGYTTRYTLRN